MTHPLSPLSINQTINNPSPILSNTNSLSVSQIAVTAASTLSSIPATQVGQSKKWVSPLSKEGLRKREAAEILTNTTVKKRLGFQSTSIKNLVNGLPVSTPIEDLRLIEEILSKIENKLTKFPVSEISDINEEMRIKNLIYSALHRVNSNPKEIICELSLCFFYLVRDHNLPTIQTTFFEKRLSEINEELDYLDAAFFPSLELCSSGKMDYILNVFTRHIVTPDAICDRAGCILVSRLLDVPVVKKLFNYEYGERLKQTLSQLALEATSISNEINKYKNQRIHSSMEWVVRCDLKLQHQVEIEHYHALSACIKMLLSNLRQLNGEGNCFSVGPIIVLSVQHPKILVSQALAFLYEGEYRLQKLKSPIRVSWLIELALQEELIAKDFDKNELENSTHLLTVLAGLGLDKSSLPAENSLSFSSLLSSNNNNNQNPDLFGLQYTSSLKYNYLLNLLVEIVYFCDTNSIVESDILPVSQTTTVSVLRSKKVLENDGTQKGEKQTTYKRGRLYFLTHLFSKIKEVTTVNISPDEALVVDLYFQKWTETLVDSLWLFPFRKKTLHEDTDLEECVIVKEDGSYIHPPKNHSLIFQGSNGFAFTKNNNLQRIYDSYGLMNLLLSVSEEVLAPEFEKNKKVISFQKTLANYLKSYAFDALVLSQLNKLHSGWDEYLLDSKDIPENPPLFVAVGGEGVRSISGFFKQPTDLIFSHQKNSKTISKRRNTDNIYHFFLKLQKKLAKFIKKQNIDTTAYYPILARSEDHIFTLSPSSFSSLLAMDTQQVTQFIDQKIIRRGKRGFNTIIGQEAAEFIIEKFFPGEISEKMDLYFTKNQTYREFCEKLKSDLSEDEQAVLAFMLYLIFNSLSLELDTIERILDSLPDVRKKNPTLSADQILNCVKKVQKKQTVEIFVLARLIAQALLENNIEAPSPIAIERAIAEEFDVPHSIELADLNYQVLAPPRETPEHVRLCVIFNYLTEDLTFVERGFTKTKIWDKEENRSILDGFFLRDCAKS